MFETLCNILFHTPAYVFLLFGYLIYAGLQASRDRIVSLKRTIILPAVFLYFSFDALKNSFAHTPLVLTIWSIAFLGGIGLGWLQVCFRKIKIDKIKKLLFLPGTWSTLLIILSIFIIKYYFGYQHARHPELFQNVYFTSFALIIYGSTSGLFIGRLINYLYRFYHHEHHDLTK
jgi:hypothetical protein